ncbi:dihydrofolate reductase family protein [Spirosoma soli]|uniref:Dihydrofolate reductase family protein n=1 Tax=Spirosoma soli TaxID=1770529 RepID=A0ABW5LYX4_9BACT
MKTIHLLIASSLDGYIAGSNGEVDWLTPFESVDYGYNAFIDTIDTILMGNNTYKEVLSFGEFPYKSKINYVFTRNAEPQDAPYVQFITGNATEFIKALKQQNGLAIWLVGGGRLITTLLQAELIDKITLFIIPVTIGRGIPLFPPSDHLSSWTLFDVKALDKGMVQLDYIKK